MTQDKLTQIPIATLTGILGLKTQKIQINPMLTSDMAREISVTFRPLPNGYDNESVVEFREKLDTRLRHFGVSVIPWNQACRHQTQSIYNVFRNKKVGKNINAVFDVDRKDTVLRGFLKALAEKIYLLRRRKGMAVMEVLRLSAWADDFVCKHIQNLNSTQIITMAPFDDEFCNHNSTYNRKITIGLFQLTKYMSEMVIGVDSEKFSLVNLNLSDSVYPNEGLDNFLLKSLVPKLFGPVTPPLLNKFNISDFNPIESESVQKLSNLSQQIGLTGLFPKGSAFKDKVARQSHVDVIEKMLEGRTASSYGFIAIAESPTYVDAMHVDLSAWNKFSDIEGLDPNYIRISNTGRWYIKVTLKRDVIFQEVPDIWVAISRSGCDKSNLNASADIVKIGLIKGKLQLKMPSGANLSKKDIRPSFDSYVILAQALAVALYMPEMARREVAIVHFHGYPSLHWFESGEYYSGELNPSLPCGTAEAALLNYLAIYDMASKGADDAKLLCVVESEHGVNVMSADTPYLVERLSDGARNGMIQLGGQYLPELKSNDPTFIQVAAA